MAEAVAAGFRSVHALPMRLRGSVIGAPPSLGHDDRGFHPRLTTPPRSGQPGRPAEECGSCSGVEGFVFDRTYGISGAQPIDEFVQAIEREHAAVDATTEHLQRAIASIAAAQQVGCAE